jgi:hypothetical protein
LIEEELRGRSLASIKDPSTMNTMKKLAAIAVVGAALSVTQTAQAQNVISGHSRGLAVALNATGGWGYWGGRARINPEFQLHFGGNYEAHMLGLGLAFAGESGNYLAVTARYQYDYKPIGNVAFFISPYAGADIGMVFYRCGGTNDCAAFALSPMLGLDLKLIMFDRLLLGIRPIGLVFPIGFGGRLSGWGLEGGVSIGITF